MAPRSLTIQHAQEFFSTATSHTIEFLFRDLRENSPVWLLFIAAG